MLFLSLLICLFFFPAVCSAGLSVSASVDDKNIAYDSYTLLTIKGNNTEKVVEKVYLPSMSFDVETETYDPSGAGKKAFSYVYRLTPRRNGINYNIPPITVKAGGRAVSTGRIVVMVGRVSGGGSQDLKRRLSSQAAKKEREDVFSSGEDETKAGNALSRDEIRQFIRQNETAIAAGKKSVGDCRDLKETLEKQLAVETSADIKKFLKKNIEKTDGKIKKLERDIKNYEEENRMYGNMLSSSKYGRESADGRAGKKAEKKNGPPEIFVKTYTDRDSVYPGEGFRFYARIYSRQGLKTPPAEFVNPSYSNIYTEDDSPLVKSTGTEIIGGLKYTYSGFEKNFYPISVGKAGLSDIKFRFTGPFAAGGRTVGELSGEDISVAVLSFPSPVPEGFSGTVGRGLKISASAENISGDNMDLLIELSGAGDFKYTKFPAVPSDPHFKAYAMDAFLGGSAPDSKKEFNYSLLVYSTADVKIPSVDFIYFNPDSRKYETARTGEIRVKGNETSEQNSIPRRKIYTVFNNTDDGKSALVCIAGLPKAVKAAPLLIFLCLLGPALVKNGRGRGNFFRQHSARSRTRGCLKAADRLIADKKYSQTVSLVYDSFLKYLSERCGRKIDGYTRREASSEIKRLFRRLSQSDIISINEFWEYAESQHYSPADVSRESAEDLVNSYSLLLDLIDDKMK